MGSEYNRITCRDGFGGHAEFFAHIAFLMFLMCCVIVGPGAFVKNFGLFLILTLVWFLGGFIIIALVVDWINDLLGMGEFPGNIILFAGAMVMVGVYQDFSSNSMEAQFCDQAKTATENIAKAQATHFKGSNKYAKNISQLQNSLIKENPKVDIQIPQKVTIEFIVSDNKSFILKASHSSCDKDDDGKPDVFIWDSSRVVPKEQ